MIASTRAVKLLEYSYMAIAVAWAQTAAPRIMAMAALAEPLRFQVRSGVDLDAWSCSAD
jgi:hypothetical protein